MPMRLAVFFPAGLLALAAGAWGAVAQTPVQDIIATRQAGFGLQQGLMNAIKRAIAANEDPSPFANGVGAIADWTRQIPALFPVGSETGHETRAKPAVWSDRANFEKAAATAATEAAKLAQFAKAGDRAAFAGQFDVLDRSCNACHRNYRERR